MHMLSASELASRLDDIFSVLVGGARSAPPRHQALRATLDWSYDLLEDDERAVFKRLSVFADGFGLAAAEQVAAGEDIESARCMARRSASSSRSPGPSTRWVGAPATTTCSGATPAA